MNQAPGPAIPAAKNLLGDEAIFYLLALPALKKQFHHVLVQQCGSLPRPATGPLILYLNHSSWWDGYLMMLCHRRLLGRRFSSYLLMEEKQLRDYRFFAWCGAFSINRHDPADVQRSLDYISGLLRRRRERALFIFPQGKIVHPDRRPLETYSGVARIALALEQATLCPLVFRYEFGGRQKATAYIRIGPSWRLDPTSAADHELQHLLDRITADLAAQCDHLRDDVVAGRHRRFAPLLRGNRGIDERFDILLKLWRRARAR
jgi:chlorobactene lauroyltransferase